MAPNVKQLSLATATLQDLGITPPPKYLPLTHPSTSTNPPAFSLTKVEQRAQKVSDRYWDWTTTESTSSSSSPSVDVFSASHLESNLVQESERLTKQQELEQQEKEGHEVVHEHDDEHDYYWAEGETIVASSLPQQEKDTITVAVEPKNDSYWLWKDDSSNSQRQQQRTMITRILEEEFARKQVSAEKIQHILQGHRQSTTTKTATTQSQHDSYWSWKPDQKDMTEEDFNQYWEWTDEDLVQIDRASLIESILQQEANRQMFSADHLVQQLLSAKTSSSQQQQQQQQTVVSCSQPNPHQQEDVSCCSRENDNYWTWSSSSTTTSRRPDYWDWSVRPVLVATNGDNNNKSYWDW